MELLHFHLFRNACTTNISHFGVAWDITLVLGFNIDPQLHSSLEKQIFEVFEAIVRGSQCPSILATNQRYAQALVCLKKLYSKEAVPDPKGSGRMIPIFHSFYENAKHAAFLDEKITELNTRLTKEITQAQRNQIHQQILTNRKRKSQCLLRFRDIFFADAAVLKHGETSRHLQLYGADICLEELINYYEQGISEQRLSEAHDLFCFAHFNNQES